MKAFDASILRAKDKAGFYHDLAMAEYQLYAYTLDTEMMRSSAEHHLLAAQNNPKDFYAYWNAAFGYAYIGECELMEENLRIHEAQTPKKYMDTKHVSEIERLRKRCEPKS
jgi:hypothetical protein